MRRDAAASLSSSRVRRVAVVAEPVLKPGIGDDDEEDGNSLRDLYLIVFNNINQKCLMELAKFQLN